MLSINGRIEEKLCAHCGVKFLPSTTRQYACSDKCRALFINFRNKELRKLKKKTIPEKECTHCRIKYLPITDKSNYCSNKCSQRAKYEKNPYNKETFGSGTTANRGVKQSKEHIENRRKSLERTLSLTKRQCIKCSEEYTPTIASQKYCSGRCWVSAWKAKKSKTANTKIAISKEHYGVLYDLQNGKCAICKCESGGNVRGDKLAVDHCHTSGNIRGLLCHRCNTGIGLFKDNKESLLAAIEYLKVAEERN